MGADTQVRKSSRETHVASLAITDIWNLILKEGQNQQSKEMALSRFL